MNTLSCPVCSATLMHAFQGRILGQYDIGYFRCPNCGLLRTESPHWLDQAYQDAITLTDTGILQRNHHLATRMAPLLHYCVAKDGAYLDIAGGYGIFTRLMRDRGFDYYWDDKYCNNLLAKGFNAEQADRPFAALTAFEVMEHVHDPMAFIEDAMARHGTRTLVFTTELYGGDRAPDSTWWYYAFETGQHICFYQENTCRQIAKRLGLNFLSANGIHMLTDRNISKVSMKLATSAIARPMAMYLRHLRKSLTLSDHIRMKQLLDR